MAINDLDISKVRSLSQVLARTPNGLSAIELARRLGLWTYVSHQNDNVRQPFIANLETATDEEITAQAGYWTSEFGRILELQGVFLGQREQLRIQLKVALAESRSRARKAHSQESTKSPRPKPLTATELNDMAEEDAEVISLQEKLGLMELLLAQTGAAKEATTQYLATLSREISFRGDHMKARLYN
jgi:hypothetical protein